MAVTPRTDGVPPRPARHGGPEGRRGPVGAGAIALLLYLIFAFRFFHHTVDDAFISFRYAGNLASGLGLVYNPGERVEGYTNFLWVLLLELGIRLHLDPETTARWLGLLAGAALILAAVRFAARNSASPWTVWIAPVFLALHPAMAVWAVGGMETPLFACLATWGICLAAFEAEAGSLRPASAFLLALAALTRPEGVLIAVLVVTFALCPGPRSRPPVRNVAGWAAVFLILWIPYFLWRWSYYGYLLPNTFYAKVDLRGVEIARGLAYLAGFAKVTGYWLIVPIAGLAFLRPRRSVLVVAGVTAAYFAYLVYIGGDGLPMYRFFVPMLGPLFLLVAWGMAGWRERLRMGSGLAATTTLALGAAAVWSAQPNFRGPDYDYVQQDVREVAAWKEVGLWFRRNAAAGDSIAVLPAGAMPYFSGLKTIDMLGLNDVTIAHTRVALGRGQAGHEKYNTDYVLRRSPTYVIIGVYGLAPERVDPARMVLPYYPVEQSLLMSETFRKRYRAEVAQTPGGYFVYFRRVPGREHS